MKCIVQQFKDVLGFRLQGLLLVVTCLVLTAHVGCHRRRPLDSYPQAQPSQDFLQRIEYADLCNDSCSEGCDLMSGPPLTVSNFHSLEPLELTLDQCVLLALQGSKVMQRLGGAVVSSPQAVTTALDPALQETNPQIGAEAALSAFDTQFSSSFFFNRSERAFNNVFFGAGAGMLTTNASTFQAQLQKRTATGATLTMSNQIDYNRNNSPANLFGSAYDVVNLVELRQPIAQGYGPLINRIAGPNAAPGQYNGVLIARIRGDLSLADFESAVRDLVRDVERNYWELYFAYRDLDTKIKARDSARETWENRELRLEGGLDRPDDEAQARQQYFNFESQVVNALAGTAVGQAGLIGAERNLRRLLGLPVADGKVIRPVTEPVAVPIVFDWADSQIQTLARRVELRRQKWLIRQRELELIAAKQLNRWRFDLVGQYGFRGFGDDLFGNRDRPNGSAFDDLFEGNLDDWQLGVELGGPIGLRQNHLAVRNAELTLNREKVVLKEQQRQLLHDLSAALVEVDRAYEAMRASFNNRVAIQEELIPKRERFSGGEDQIFFLLDVQQRLANVESTLQRTLVDYNIALMEYARTTGSLLSRYNIRLSEGAWSDDAYAKARVNAARLQKGAVYRTDGCDKLSAGCYDQTLPGPSFVAGTQDAYYKSEFTEPQATSLDDQGSVSTSEDDVSDDDDPVREMGNLSVDEESTDFVEPQLDDSTGLNNDLRQE